VRGTPKLTPKSDSSQVKNEGGSVFTSGVNPTPTIVSTPFTGKYLATDGTVDYTRTAPALSVGISPYPFLATGAQPISIVNSRVNEFGVVLGGKEGYIGAYSPESRRQRIAKFLEKRSRRVWTKKVKYDVRKNFADSRLRVKGRFVKKEDEEVLRDLLHPI
jgi:hypothetical protein